MADTYVPVLPAEEYDRRCRRVDSLVPHLWDLLDAVKDPEIPAVSIWELGILQDIEVQTGRQVTITITPTYSGCPAMDAITEDIGKVLSRYGYEAKVDTRLSPAWSSSWISEQAREKMREAGIAPPVEHSDNYSLSCPQCGGSELGLISQFGSTACKALYRCQSCEETFDYFKPI